MSSQGFKQVQKQTQSLVLAPQLRNSLKILQAPAFELRTSILEELNANPLLEELPIESISIEDHRDLPNENEREANEELDFNSEDFSVLDKMNEDMREYYAQENTGQSHSVKDDERRNYFMNSLTESLSLQQHLISQAELTDCSDKESQALLYLIGCLDDNGYLTESISNIALAAHIPYGTVLSASEILKSFEPAGIGTEDMRDCLATQLELRGRGDTLAAKILREHFDLLVRRRVPELKRKTGAINEDIQAAIEEISTLEPAPGKRFSPDSNSIIEPDVTVYQNEYDEWQVVLNLSLIHI